MYDGCFNSFIYLSIKDKYFQTDFFFVFWVTTYKDESLGLKNNENVLRTYLIKCQMVFVLFNYICWGKEEYAVILLCIGISFVSFVPLEEKNESKVNVFRDKLISPPVVTKVPIPIHLICSIL